MHSAVRILEFWALAFVTLGAALVLLNVFFSAVGNDIELHSLRTEAIIGAIASLIEGTSVWVILTVIPAAARALFIPILIVGLLYRLSHLRGLEFL